MDREQPRVLAVDDEILNLEILGEYIEDAGYTVVKETSGDRAWERLEEDPEGFDAIVLDRMMPKIDGIEVLKRVKEHPQLNLIPVILQTAKSAKQDIREGLEAGAYYYLTKPFDRATLVAVVGTAVSDYRRYRALREAMEETSQTLSLMEQGVFRFRSLDEGRRLAALLAKACPDASTLVLGLSELVTNAVEHGNLGIGYDEKSALIEQGRWETEINARLAWPEFSDRKVTLEFSQNAHEIRFTIRDQGEGFDWQEYMEFTPERAMHTHGRGISLAKALSFDVLEYRGQGNEVLAIKYLSNEETAANAANSDFEPSLPAAAG